MTDATNETMSSPDDLPSAERLSGVIAQLAIERELTLATAESLTGGKISCQLAAAESSSDWFAGSVVAYASRVKHDVLGVPDGPVISADCAAAMAEGVARLLGADLTVAVTGVGGPDDQEGQPPGTVWFGLRIDGATVTELRHFDGDPAQIVDDTTQHALELVLAQLRSASAGK